MKAAIIAPTGLLSRYCDTGYHLALAHVAKQDITYMNFYRGAMSNGEFVILDNSVIELGRPVSYEELRSATRQMMPSEVVLCDYPRDPKKTLEWAYENGPKFKEEFPDIQLMAVPQWYGSMNLMNWLDSMWHLAEFDFVDTIGIPKFLTTQRPRAVEELTKSRPNKQFHLLGTWGNPIEVRQYKSLDWIRGVDTKAPVRFGKACVALHPHRGLMAARNAVPALDFWDYDDPMPIITRHNCDTFLDWATKEVEVGEGTLSVLR